MVPIYFYRKIALRGLFFFSCFSPLKVLQKGLGSWYDGGFRLRPPQAGSFPKGSLIRVADNSFRRLPKGSDASGRALLKLTTTFSHVTPLFSLFFAHFSPSFLLLSIDIDFSPSTRQMTVKFLIISDLQFNPYPYRTCPSTPASNAL